MHIFVSLIILLFIAYNRIKCSALTIEFLSKQTVPVSFEFAFSGFPKEFSLELDELLIVIR